MYARCRPGGLLRALFITLGGGGDCWSRPCDDTPTAHHHGRLLIIYWPLRHKVRSARSPELIFTISLPI